MFYFTGVAPAVVAYFPSPAHMQAHTHTHTNPMLHCGAAAPHSLPDAESSAGLTFVHLQIFKVQQFPGSLPKEQEPHGSMCAFLYSLFHVFISCVSSSRTFNETSVIYQLTNRNGFFFFPLRRRACGYLQRHEEGMFCVFPPPPTAKQTHQRHSWWLARHLAPSRISTGCQRA